MVKIDAKPFDEAPDNEPHVGCAFQIDFFGFDQGNLWATYQLDLHSPTGSGTLETGSVFIGEDPAGGGTDFDNAVTIDLMGHLAASGVQPQPNQGYHVRLNVNAQGSIGADTKHKMLLVTCGAAPATTTPPTSAPTVLPTTVTPAPPPCCPPRSRRRPRPGRWPSLGTTRDAACSPRSRSCCSARPPFAPRTERSGATTIGSAMTEYDPQTALLVIDVQNDFADPSGNLYVSAGETIVPTVNAEIDGATAAGALVVYTQDWHPESTPHFQEEGGVWPVHCVHDTWGAELHPELRVSGGSVKKGSGGEDGYSGFSVRDPESGVTAPTELERMLRERGIERVVVCGLATDYCVVETVLDARRLGFDTAVLTDAVRAVNLQPGDGERAIERMQEAGARVG